MAGFFSDDDEDGPKGAKKKPGGIFTQDMGPLPVWGWAAVAVAAVFIYRMMVKPKSTPGDDKAQQSPVPFPTGGVGGVFLIPSGTNAPPSSQPPVVNPPAPSTTAGLFDWVNHMIGGVLANDYMNQGVAPDDAAGRAFLNQTAAAASMGAPHVISSGGTGYVYDPRSGKQILASTFNAMSEQQRQALTTGDATAWASI